VSSLQTIYDARFQSTGIEKRRRVWTTLCDAYFNARVKPTDTVLDIACGYGEFSNNIRAGQKLAIDLNRDSPKFLNPDVSFKHTSASDLSHIPNDTVDVAFTSNFLEHLPDKSACDAVLLEVKRVLKPGGRFIIMGPNIRFAYREYWDYYDHYLALSDRSLAEGLTINGYVVEEVIPRFLPYTMNNKRPTHDSLIRAYLALPIIWPVFGRQFLVTGRK
jgi:ubiquinone/menaquinone biosynthesis C-methylase UbiE